MPRVIYLGLFALPEHTPMTLSALQQADEESVAIAVESPSDSQFDILSNWLQDESKPEALVIWPKPTAFIADCLARDEAIDDSLIEWKNMAGRLLKLFRRHRSQLTLLGIAPGEVPSPSNELPTQIAEVITQVEETAKRLPQAKPLYLLAAAQLAVEDSELQEMLSFLTASSQVCGTPIEQTNETVRLALQSANESLNAEQQLKILTQERDSAAEENKLLLTQLADVQNALETAEQKSQQLKKITEERDSAQEENELLLTQLHIVQEALEKAYLKNSSSNVEAESKDQERLKSLITWLRAHARRQARAAYSNAESKTLQDQIKLLEKSELFDADWYLEQYKDVAKANINPAEHFIKFGAIEGRNPSPRFNTEFYVLNYPDITSSGLHPLLHYLRDGIKEQRKTQESTT
ncbi:hypothetical protein QT231_11890 [Halomonas sp. SpR1]|uniref:hypothetical protein n=1 Tax=Halomonas sp. SpR1 TaxID=3050462 RepID=UPI0027E41D12|nr:hypothetical protein [Halomonas sp. SpR1]MDQ7733402.1 hypothetical protein [Halomonas sp. SpR1]